MFGHDGTFTRKPGDREKLQQPPPSGGGRRGGVHGEWRLVRAVWGGRRVFPTGRDVVLTPATGGRRLVISRAAQAEPGDVVPQQREEENLVWPPAAAAVPGRPLRPGSCAAASRCRLARAAAHCRSNGWGGWSAWPGRLLVS